MTLILVSFFLSDIDPNHPGVRRSFSLDTANYDVRHLLRKQGDRLIYNYNYDMGDNWCHIIKVLSIQDMGTTLQGSDMKDLDAQVFKAVGKKEWKLQCSSLLWGEINCPPENSEGCDGLGRYGSILEKGPDYKVPNAQKIINWTDHDIQYAETVRRKEVTSSKCNYCGKVKGSNSGLKLYTCSRCKRANYCSLECQKKDWKKHKQTCTRPAAP